MQKKRKCTHLASICIRSTSGRILVGGGGGAVGVLFDEALADAEALDELCPALEDGVVALGGALLFGVALCFPVRLCAWVDVRSAMARSREKA